MLGIVSSNIVIIGVVAGIPAIVSVLVVLWSMPRRVAWVALAASVLGVILVGVSAWAVFRPSTEQAAAGPRVGMEPPVTQPSPTAASPTPPGGACSPSGDMVNVVAKGIAFAESCLAAPADKAFSIDFDNQDAGVPHNVHIYSKDPATDPNAESLFAGDIVTGPKTVTYQVNPLPAGTYYFHCDVHPTQMRGTFVVG